MAARTRFAVVGLGFGEYHVRTIANMGDADLVAVADFDDQRLERVGSAYHCRTYKDAAQMMDELDLDAVSVCVSPAYRAPILQAAADANLAVFVEKPWASNARHAAELREICRANESPVMTGFSFRFHPVVQRAIAAIRDELGSVQLGSGAYVFGWLPPAEHWLWDPANGGGYFNENSCHLLDVVCALAGRPEEVFAYGVRDSDRPSDKAATVAIRLAGGGTVSLNLGGVGTGAVTDYPWLELFTRHGYARLTGQNHVWRKLEWARHENGEVHRFDAPPEQLGRTRYTDALEHFVSALRAGSAPEASIDDGVLMVQLADAIRESIRSGRPVSISGNP